MTRGVPVGKQRVQKLMELHGIRARGKRRFEVTTDSHHQLPISPGWLDREFTVAGPDKVWVGDITYLATDEGWLDMGGSLRGDMTSNLVTDVLRMARFRRPPGQAGQAAVSQRSGRPVRQRRLQGRG